MGKKVCILTSVHLPFDTRIFYKQAKSLVEAGYDVTLIAQHDRNELVDGVRIVPLPKPKNRARRLLGIWRVLRLAAKQKADIYHFHDPELIPATVLLKLITRKNIIYDIHEDIPKQILTKEWLPHCARSYVSGLYTLVQRATFPFFDAIIAAGEDIAYTLPQSDKLYVVRNYPSIEILSRTSLDEKTNKDLPLLIYAGQLTTDYCIREMVQAVKYLEGKAKLLLLGTFTDVRLEEEMRAMTSRYVEFMGQVPYETVLHWMRRAVIGLVCLYPDPNIMKASGRNRKLYEYMAAGLPVIASNFPLWKEIVEGNNCGITVDPLNPQEIAKATEYLLSHPDEAIRMGENGRKAVLEKYNWETESKKLLAVYQELLKAKDTKQ
jgi:glycosyltransferase involved in cell wall biosynthesis